MKQLILSILFILSISYSNSTHVYKQKNHSKIYNEKIAIYLIEIVSPDDNDSDPITDPMIKKVYKKFVPKHFISLLKMGNSFRPFKGSIFKIHHVELSDTFLRVYIYN